VAWVERQPGDPNAVDYFALNPTNSIPRVQTATWVVGETRNHFDVEAPLREFARKEQPLCGGLRVEPLSDE